MRGTTTNWTVYTIVNRITGEQYQGQTINDVHQRFRAHLSAARRGSTTRLAKAIRRYGEQHFELADWISFPADADGDGSILDKLEQVLVKLGDSQTEGKGYNTTPGGEQKRLRRTTKDRKKIIFDVEPEVRKF